MENKGALWVNPMKSEVKDSFSKMPNTVSHSCKQDWIKKKKKKKSIPTRALFRSIMAALSESNLLASCEPQ